MKEAAANSQQSSPALIINSLVGNLTPLLMKEEEMSGKEKKCHPETKNKEKRNYKLLWMENFEDNTFSQ